MKYYKRTQTRPVFIKNVQVGGQNKVIIQSMTTFQPKDIKNSVKQINELALYGCELVRMAIYDKEDAKAIKEIKKQTDIPLIADIHFNYTLAFEAIENGIDKIRINPGTIGKHDNLIRIVAACKANKIPIRLGVNSGSLEKDIIEKYGWTATAMIVSAQRNIAVFEKLNFHDLVISLKASDVQLAIKSYQKAAVLFPYPLHLGITEAGSMLRGAVKSATGLGILLQQEIGDTIRVSLSCDPIKEILVAKQLLSTFDLTTNFPDLVACPTCGRLQYEMFPVVDEIEKFLDTKKGKIRVAIMGCPVNGIGEAKESNVALAGGKDSGMIYIDGKFDKVVKSDDMVKVLKEEINKYLAKQNESKNTK